MIETKGPRVIHSRIRLSAPISPNRHWPPLHHNRLIILHNKVEGGITSTPCSIHRPKNVQRRTIASLLCGINAISGQTANPALYCYRFLVKASSSLPSPSLLLLRLVLFLPAVLVGSFQQIGVSQTSHRTRSIVHQLSTEALLPLLSLKSSSSHFLSSLDSDNSGTNNVEEEDLLRWERMYQEGGRKSNNIWKEVQPLLEDTTTIQRPVQNNNSILTQQQQQSFAKTRTEIRVITFDLDNTLWQTSATIASANDGLAAFLTQHEIVQPIRVEQLMNRLFTANRERYCPMDPVEGKSPVLITLLRKDAIRTLLTEYNGYESDEKVDLLTEQAFQLWTTCRHEAIPNHLAKSVLPCLERITSLIRTRQGSPVLVGAITDGNSDPRLVRGLSQYFDFCINAEIVGIGKPDKRVYLNAARYVMTHPSMQDLLPPPVPECITDEFLEEMIGPYWIHIGDDFTKDVVPAKTLNMRTIWARELILDKVANGQVTSQTTCNPERSVEKLVETISSMKVVEMQVGAEDYLAEALKNEFADAVVDRFEELTDILLEWHGGGDSTLPTVLKDQEAVTEPIYSEEETIKNQPMDSALVLLDETKYCLYCGQKLPTAAAFCSSCGKRQQ